MKFTKISYGKLISMLICQASNVYFNYGTITICILSYIYIGWCCKVLQLSHCMSLQCTTWRKWQEGSCNLQQGISWRSYLKRQLQISKTEKQQLLAKGKAPYVSMQKGADIKTKQRWCNWRKHFSSLYPYYVYII